MSIEGVKPLRYVVSASLKDIYDADMEGFNAVAQDPTMLALSNENDAVSGTERFYNYILHAHSEIVTDLNNITGAEGFLGSIKKGTNALIQTVKDFFKWIWSFFSAKEKKIDVKLDNVDLLLKSKGVKSGDITYPQSTAYIYPKPGKPVGDLGWVEETNKRVAKGITNCNSYSTKLTDVLESLERLAKDHRPVKEMTDRVISFNGDLKKIFSANSNDKGTFITTDDFIFGVGKIVYRPSSNTRKDFHGVTFTTTQTTINSIWADARANLVQLKKLTLTLHKVEKTMIDVLTLLSNNKDVTTGTHGVFSGVIRNGMDNIRTFENALYKTLNTVADLCKASVN